MTLPVVLLLLMAPSICCLLVLPQDCSEVYQQDNSRPSGVYTIFPIGPTSAVPPQVCQRRLDGSVNFYRPWDHYKTGFGTAAGEYWLGLENLFYLTQRKQYKTNTDKKVMVLKFTDLDGDGIGMISWFAVHPVSMNYTNQMLSSDNMGYASYLLEQDKNPGLMPGQGSFVAGFSSSNLGDVSPNTKGPRCANTGLPCDYLNSSCPVGGTVMCQAYGPGQDMFESTRIIGHNIYMKAKELYAGAVEEVTGPLHSAHQWVNMTNVRVQINSMHSVRTCKPALGHSFAAGTIEGGGGLNFTQGAVEGDPFWDGIRDAILGQPSNDTQECHRPKPILFSTGEVGANKSCTTAFWYHKCHRANPNGGYRWGADESLFAVGMECYPLKGCHNYSLKAISMKLRPVQQMSATSTTFL